MSTVSALLAEGLGLSSPDVETMRWVGILHDAGKLAVPAEVLSKPGPLTAAEWELVKKHPALGADMVIAVSPALAPVAGGIRAHHERWDGSGYPDGLEGDGIPLFGRIVAVADVFDALTHKRDYRSGTFSHLEAATFITERSRRDFDPEVVDVFVELDRRGLIPPDQRVVAL